MILTKTELEAREDNEKLIIYLEYVNNLFKKFQENKSSEYKKEYTLYCLGVKSVYTNIINTLDIMTTTPALSKNHLKDYQNLMYRHFAFFEENKNSNDSAKKELYRGQKQAMEDIKALFSNIFYEEIPNF